MKKRILLLIVLFLSVFSLAACNEGKVENIKPVNPGDISIPSIAPSIPDTPSNEPSNDASIPSVEISTPSVDNPDVITYTVTVIYNKKTFDLDADVKAIWTNGQSLHQTEFDENSKSSIEGLDGEFNVYLSDIPDKYTYDPNIYKANKDNPNVVIELQKITTFKRDQGTGKDLYNAYQISSEGYFRAEIKKANQIIYFEYAPQASGVYFVESLVNTFDDEINPKLDVHDGSTQYKNPTASETVDTGGISKDNGFTKNFKWTLKMSADQKGCVYTFGVKAKGKLDEYPIIVDFKIKYLTEYEYMGIVSTLMTPTDERVLYGTEVTDEYPMAEYVYYNADGGTGNYYNSEDGTSIENSLLDGTKFVYNEEDKYWHYLSPNGPILCAAIDVPCAYFDEALNKVESHGNKNLTVNKGTENYKQFIEDFYTRFSNSDGVCYVTMELKEFLQKYSTSQMLVNDGYGQIEVLGTNSKESDQWLFACGYYLPKQ